MRQIVQIHIYKSLYKRLYTSFLCKINRKRREINMDINYELYKVFYYVATSLSFSEASKKLFISQSAVSQSIKTLEKKLIDCDMDYKGLADAIGTSTVTLSKKVNTELDFKLGEAEKIAEVLNLSDAEFLEVFLSKSL